MATAAQTQVRPTQQQMFYNSVRKTGEQDELFLELVRDGLTRHDLARNIERNPRLWLRYSAWLHTLPN